MKIRIAIAIAVLTAAMPVMAANNDAVMNSGSQITIDSVTLTLTGTQAESITVNANDFVASMSTGSTLEVTAGNLRRLTHTASVNTLTVTNECNSNTSKLTILNNDPNTVSVTIAIASDTCGSSSTGSTGGGGGIVSGGGGGGGGGGGYIPPVTPTNPSTPATTTPALAVPLTGQTPTPATAVVSTYVFTRSLYVGRSGEDVRELQRVLALDPELYPEGIVSGYFGSLTRAAVQRFQERYGIASKGAQGYGIFGPASRAKFMGVYGISTGSVQGVTQAGMLTMTLKKGMTNAEVKILQMLLNKDIETQVATTGAGSVSNETDYFGTATEAAVKKFQSKHGIEVLGIVGPMTRAKLNSL